MSNKTENSVETRGEKGRLTGRVSLDGKKVPTVAPSKTAVRKVAERVVPTTPLSAEEFIAQVKSLNPKTIAKIARAYRKEEGEYNADYNKFTAKDLRNRLSSMVSGTPDPYHPVFIAPGGALWHALADEYRQESRARGESDRELMDSDIVAVINLGSATWRALTLRHEFDPKKFDTITRTWRKYVGPISPWDL